MSSLYLRAKALKLLLDLEELNLIRVLKKTRNPNRNCPISTLANCPPILANNYNSTSPKAAANGNAISD